MSGFYCVLLPPTCYHCIVAAVVLDCSWAWCWVVRPVLDTTTHTYDTTRRLDGCTGIPAVPIEHSLLHLSFVVIGAGNAEHARFHPFSPARPS
jgi:hypothetical protein